MRGRTGTRKTSVWGITFLFFFFFVDMHCLITQYIVLVGNMFLRGMIFSLLCKPYKVVVDLEDSDAPTVYDYVVNQNIKKR